MPIIILFFSGLLTAATIEVKYGLYEYDLDVKKEVIKLTGNSLSLSLAGKKGCKQDVFPGFRKNLLSTAKDLPVVKGAKDNRVEIKFEGKKTQLSPQSAQGRYFLSMPDRFKKLKLEQSFLCK